MTDTSSTLDAASSNAQHFAASVNLIYSPIYFLIVKLKQLPKGMTSCIVNPTICSDLLWIHVPTSQTLSVVHHIVYLMRMQMIPYVESPSQFD